ncbi:PAS domain-containing protein [Microcoleus sp. MOSTC5]|uniref:PAS domain-containing protein n=1 Tax=Microcoleus sp. MOSTC5 TaxID=3055378 RepID=UPI002FD6D8D0
MDNVQSIVVALDRSQNVNYVNPFFFRVTGYTHQEVLGKNWFDNLLPCYSQQLIKTINITCHQLS